MSVPQPHHDERPRHLSDRREQVVGQTAMPQLQRDVRRRVLTLVNPRSGLPWSFSAFRAAMDKVWDVGGTELYYQFCKSVADGVEKARRAVDEGVDIVLVAGGDGTVSTVGRVLVGTRVLLGVIPAGSGNGFARHFGIPLSPARAARALAEAIPVAIDVGVVNGLPFLVTCSMAWDAAVARSFQKMPVRGILPYVFAGVQELLGYKPQPVEVIVDASEKLFFEDPLVLTVANLTQFGGGALIAPKARPDDGLLELVVALRQDIPKLVANAGRLFNGTIDRIPEVIMRRFRTLDVLRKEPAPIQIDGELFDAPSETHVRVMPSALRVLVPKPGKLG